MPKPVYIICSESGAEDKLTSMLSYFNIVESLILTTPPPGQVRPFRFRVFGVWSREDGDEVTQDYETQFVVFMPPEGTEVALTQVSPVLLPLNADILKVYALYDNLLPFKSGGQMVIENRVRRKGDTQWKAMQYPIKVVDARQVSAPVSSA